MIISVLCVTAQPVVRIAFVVIAVTLGVVTFAGQWTEVREALARLSPAVVGAALLAVLAGLLVSMVVWRLILAALGSPLPYRVAARVLFVGQLGKYLPGTVWPVLAQMELGRDQGVPRQRSATVFVLTMLFGFGTGLLLATTTLPVVAAAEVRPFRWAFLLTPAFLVLLHPKVINPLLDRALRLTGRPALERPLTLQVAVRSVLTGAVQWLFFGVHIWLLAVGLGADPWVTARLAVGGFALAWCAGYLGVITPAGIGVREVALVAVLSPVLDRPDAIVLALVSRVVMTVADLLIAAVGAVSMRGMRYRSSSPTHPRSGLHGQLGTSDKPRAVIREASLKQPERQRAVPRRGSPER